MNIATKEENVKLIQIVENGYGIKVCSLTRKYEAHSNY